MSNFYLDLLGVNKIVDKINTSLRGRIKYKGLLALIPAGGTTRTNWNDIAPCIEGHAYILTGDEGQFIELNDVRYMTGDMIFTTNEVVIKTDGTVSANVEVKKISGGSAIIDEKTIVQNDDATYAPEGALKTEIGGWKELAVAKIEFIETDKKEFGQTWTKTVTKPGKLDDILAAHTVGELIPAKVYPADDPLDVRPFNLTYEGETPAGSAHYRMATTLAAFEGNIEFYAADADNVTIVGTFTGNRMCDNIDKTILVCILDVSYTYHSLDTKYIEKDNLTLVSEEVTGHEVEVLRAKTAIEITSFPVLAKTETMYRLTQEVTVGDKKYAKGLYVYDLSDPADPKWVSVGGSLVDEKTIRSTNDDGAIVPLYTQVGGWLDKTDISSNVKDTTLTDATSSYSFTDTKMNSIWGTKAPAKIFVTVTEKDTSTVILSSKLNIVEVTGWDNTIDFSDTTMDFSITRVPDVDFTISMKHNTAAYNKEVNVVFTVDASVIHHLDTDYIKIDKETIVSKKVLSTDEVKTLRAKSAIEVDALSTVTNPLTETIYRLTTEEIISDKKYAKGLYVYDKTGTDPVWISVGGSEVDEKTILSTNDDDSTVPLHTQIGGWLDKTDYGKNKKDTLLTDVLSTYAFTDTKFESIWGNKDPAKICASIKDKDTGNIIFYREIKIIDSSGWKDTFDFSDSLMLLTLTRNPGVNYIVNLKHSSTGFSKNVEVLFIVDASVIHYIDTDYIKFDKLTISTKRDNSFDEVKTIRAKSAIEVDSLCFITHPLTETIYNLITDETYDGKHYLAGLYIYRDYKWIRVGGYNFDLKTILSMDDNKTVTNVHTAIGGYFEKGFINIKDRSSEFNCSIDTSNNVTINAKYDYIDLNLDSDCKLYVYLLWEGISSNALSSSVTYTYNTTTKKFTNDTRLDDNIEMSVLPSGTNSISALIKNFAQDASTPDEIEFYIYKGASKDSKTVRESDSRFVNIDNKTLIRAGKDRFDNEFIRTTIGGYYDRIGDDIGHPIYGIAYVDISNLNSVDYFTMFVNSSFELTSSLEGETGGVKVHIDGKDPIYEQGIFVKVSDTEYYFDTDNYKIVLYMNGGFVESRFYMKDSSKISADYISVSVYRIMGAAGSSGVIHSIHPKYISIDGSSIGVNTTNGSLFANGIVDEIPNNYRQNWIYRQSDPFEYGGTTYPAGIYTLKNNVLTRLDASVSVDEETIISKDPDGKNIPLRTELGGRIIKSGTAKSFPDSRTMEYDEDMKMWTYDSTPYGEPEPIDFSLLSERIPFKSYVELIVTDETDPSYSKTKLIPLRSALVIDNNADYYFLDENDASNKFRAAVIICFDEKDKHIHEIMAFMYEPDTTVSSHTVKCTFKFYEYNYLSIAHPEFIPIDNKTLKLVHDEIGETLNYFTTSIGGYKEENSTAVTYVLEDKYISNTGTSSAHPGYTYFEISNAIPNNLITSLSNNKKATLTNLRIRQTGLISNQIIFKDYVTFKSNDTFGWDIQIGSSDTVLHPAIFELYTTNIIRIYVKDDDTEIDPTIGITLTVIGVKVEEVETTYHPIESKCINIDNTTLINDTTGSGETGLLRAKSAIETNKLSTITAPITETMYRLTADETIGTTTYKAGLYVYDKTTSKWITVGGGDEVKIDDLTIVKDITTGKIKTSIGGYVSTDNYETKKYDIPTITLSEPANMHIRFDNNMEYILNAGKNIQANISAVDDSYNPVSTGLKEYIYNSSEKSWTYSNSDFIVSIDYVSSSNFVVSISSSSSKNVSEFFNTSGAGISEVSNILITPISNTVYSPIESRCIKCKTDGGIVTSADGIAIKVNTSSGLTTNDSSGLTFKAGMGLIMQDGFINVKPNTSKAIILENEGVGIKLNTNTTDVGTSGDSGLLITANGIFAKHNIYYGTAEPTASNYKVGDIYIQY